MGEVLWRRRDLVRVEFFMVEVERNTQDRRRQDMEDGIITVATAIIIPDQYIEAHSHMQLQHNSELCTPLVAVAGKSSSQRSVFSPFT